MHSNLTTNFDTISPLSPFLLRLILFTWSIIKSNDKEIVENIMPAPSNSEKHGLTEEAKKSRVANASKFLEKFNQKYQKALSALLTEDSILPEIQKQKVKQLLAQIEKMRPLVENKDYAQLPPSQLKAVEEQLATFGPYIDLQPSYNLFQKHTKNIERLIQSANAIENPGVKKALEDYIQLKGEHIQLQIDRDELLQKPIDKKAFTAMRARFISAGQKIQAIQKKIEPLVNQLEKLKIQTEIAQTDFNKSLKPFLQTLQNINSEQLEELIAQKDECAIAIKKGIKDLIDFLQQDNKSLNKPEAEKLAIALDQKFKISILENINSRFNSANSTPLVDLASDLFQPVDLQISAWEKAKISVLGKTLNATLEEFDTETSFIVEHINTIQKNATALLEKIALEERKKTLDAQAKVLTSQLDRLSAEATKSPYAPPELKENISRQQEKIQALQTQYSNADAHTMEGAEIGFKAVATAIDNAQKQLTTAHTQYENNMKSKQELDSQASALLTDLASLSVKNPHHSQEQAQAFQEHKRYVETFKFESSAELLSQAAYNKFAATLPATVEKFSQISAAITAAKERIALATKEVETMKKDLNLFIESVKNDMVFLTRDVSILDQTTQTLDQHLQSTTDHNSIVVHATVEEYKKYKTQKMTDIKTKLDELFQVTKIAKQTQLNTSAENLENKIAEFNKYTAQYPFLKAENIDIDIIKKQISTYREFAATLKTDTPSLTLEDYRKRTAAIFAVEKQDSYQQNMQTLLRFLKSAKELEGQEKAAQEKLATDLVSATHLTEELFGQLDPDDPLAKKLKTLESFNKPLSEYTSDFAEEKTPKNPQFKPNNHFLQIEQGSEACFKEIKEKFITNSSATLKKASALIQSQPQQPQFGKINQQITDLTAQLEQIRSSTTTDVTAIKIIHGNVNNLLKNAILQPDPILQVINNMLVFCGNLCVNTKTSEEDKKTLSTFTVDLQKTKDEYTTNISDLSPNNKTSFDANYKKQQQNAKTTLQKAVSELKSQASPSLWEKFQLFLNEKLGWFTKDVKEYKKRFFDETLQQEMKHVLKDTTMPSSLADDNEPPSKRLKI